MPAPFNPDNFQFEMLDNGCVQARTYDQGEVITDIVTADSLGAMGCSQLHHPLSQTNIEELTQLCYNNH